MQRKIIFVILTICMFFLISGCQYSQEEKQQMEQYASQAKENATQYVYSKYGFKAKIKETKIQKTESGPVPDLTPPPTGNVFVKMEYNNKEFNVFITGEEESSQGIDNYQFQTISYDVLSKIYDKTKCSPYDYTVYLGQFFNKNDSQYNGMIYEFYDGKNLNDILTNNTFRLICEYVDDVQLENIHFQFLPSQTKAIFIQYKSMNDYHNASTHIYNILGTPIGHELYNNALNIDEAIIFENSKYQYFKPSFQEYNGIYFSSFEGDDIVIKETDIDDASCWNGHGISNAIQLSKGYTIDTNADSIYLYLPIDKIKDYKKYDSIYIGVQYTYQGEKHYKTYSSYHSQIGNYHVESLLLKDYEDVRFVVLAEKLNKTE